MRKMDDRSRALAEENYKFAIFMAGKYSWTRTEHSELVSLCCLALCKAARDFDETKGNQFTTFAAMAMHNEILMSFQRNSRQKFEKEHGTLLSLDRPVGFDELENITLGDAVGNIDSSYEVVEAIESLKKANKKVIKARLLHYYYGFNQYQVANYLGLSQSYASRIIRTPVMSKAVIK